MPDDLRPRVDLLERLQGQQERLNALLIDVTARVSEAQDLYGAALTRQDVRLELLTVLASQHDERAAQHEAQMAELRALLTAIKDMLERGNGH